MADIIQLNGAKLHPSHKWEPNPYVIEQLEKMLAAAKAGTLQAIFAVGWNTDNSISSGWQGAEYAAFTLLGGVEECKTEYMMKEFQRRK